MSLGERSLNLAGSGPIIFTSWGTNFLEGPFHHPHTPPLIKKISSSVFKGLQLLKSISDSEYKGKKQYLKTIFKSKNLMIKKVPGIM